MAQEKRVPMGITLPSKLLGKIDRLRLTTSRDGEMAGRDRSAVIERLLIIGLEARQNGEL